MREEWKWIDGGREWPYHGKPCRLRPLLGVGGGLPRSERLSPRAARALAPGLGGILPAVWPSGVGAVAQALYVLGTEWLLDEIFSAGC
jgi:hypothetical protein